MTRVLFAVLVVLALLGCAQSVVINMSPTTFVRNNYFTYDVQYSGTSSTIVRLGVFYLDFMYIYPYPAGSSVYTSYLPDYVVIRNSAYPDYLGLDPYLTIRMDNEGWQLNLLEVTNPTGAGIGVTIGTGPLNYFIPYTLDFYATSSGDLIFDLNDDWAALEGSSNSYTAFIWSFGNGANLDYQSYWDGPFAFAPLGAQYVYIPAGDTVGFLGVFRATNNANLGTILPTVGPIISDINELYNYGLLDHLSATQISRIINYNTFIGGGGGDPHIMGMDGSLFDVEGSSSQVVCLFSDTTEMLNAKMGRPLLRPETLYFHSMGLSLRLNQLHEEEFDVVRLRIDGNLDESGGVFFEDTDAVIPSPIVHLSGMRSEAAAAAAAAAAHRLQTSVISENLLEVGEVHRIGDYSIEIVDSTSPHFHEGVFEIPSSSPFDNSNAILKVAVHHGEQIDPKHPRTSYLFVVHEDQHLIEPSSNPSMDWVTYGNLLRVLNNVDEENQEKSGILVHRRIDVYVSSAGQIEPHGYIGQSHPGRKQYREEWQRWDVLEGEHSDYEVHSGDLFGTDFRFNRFVL